VKPLEAYPEMRVLGIAEASLYFIDEKNINVVINYTSYSVAGAALSVIFDNETIREYFRTKLVEYVKDICAQAQEPTGMNPIRFNTEVEPKIDFIKGQNWSRVSINFNLTGEGEPILGKSGEYWAHYEFRGGFLQLIRGGVLQYLAVVRPPIPVVLIDVLKLTVTLPKGYSAVQVVPRQSSAYVDWENDRVVLVWLFRDPSIERRDPTVPGIQTLILDIKSVSDEKRQLLGKLEDLENGLKKSLSYSFNHDEALRLLEKVSLARYEERAFQILMESYINELISEAEGFLRKIFVLKLLIAGLVPLSALLSSFVLYRNRCLKYLGKLFGRISRLTEESEKIMNLDPVIYK
jgi:hypothetical protein